MFQPVTSRVNFPQMEEKVLQFWKEKGIFQKSVDNRKGAPRFMMYEGPPTANGSPGIHHVLSRVFKDIIPRYKAMKGYYAPRIGGWDTHGLPVELEVEHRLGFTSKSDIENYGIAKFNQECRDSVFRYLKDWNSLTERIGFWLDLDHAYITMNNSYIETGWWAIKQMWDKGLVYQGYRVTPHCPRCGTSLSSHEVALGYKENTEDPSIYIKFKVAKALYSHPGFMDELRNLYGDREAEFAKSLLELTGDKDVYLVAWTTTPWTLPANTALAVSAKDDYAIVEHENEYLILATARLPYAGLENANIVAKLKGSDLVELRYEPLFNPSDFGISVRNMSLTKKDGEPSPDMIWKKEGLRNYPVIATEFVSMDDGTGIVHVAPAYGEVDYEAGQRFGLDFVHTVDLQGKVIGSYPFAGKFVKKADPLVLDDLKARGLLFRKETIRHTYPFCWRCDTPLLYYAKQTWYIKTTAVKEALIEGNKAINWYPEHIKYGRFGDWLENNIDWAFSRERYWGTPLPLWHCPACGRYECIGSVEEVRQKPGFTGLKAPLDLHRPYVDEWSFDCPQCRGRMHRVPEVIDCWFDSGAMPIAQWHYPFENKNMMEDGRFPADYICEAVDQTRGWFYSLHAISTLLFGHPSYKNVICLGHILDAKGEKMSKTRGNVVQPWDVINKYGADALRWYFYTSAPAGNVRLFADTAVADIARGFLTTLWNVYSFFVLYANIDRYDPATPAPAPESDLDKWILSELNKLILDVDSELENYDPTSAGRRLEEFVEDLSNWYVRRSRRRFWKSESDADKLSAYSTLYRCLVTLAKLVAPFMPFVAEELYQNLVRKADAGAPESIHLADFPAADKSLINEQLSTDTRLVMKLCSLGRAARAKAAIKVRQPIAEVVVSTAGAERESLATLKPQLLEELNVKEVRFDTAEKVAALQGQGYSVAAEGNYGVAVATIIPPELAAEGMAREIVHRLQTMRRSAGFEIADHIVTYYQGDEHVREVIADFGAYIKQETLSDLITEAAPAEGAFSETHKLAGHQVLLGVKKF